MPIEIMENFISQMIENLEAIEASLELLLQHYQISIEDNKVENSSNVTESVIRELLSKKAKEGKEKEIKGLLEAYGVSKLSILDSQKYGQFYDEALQI